MVACSLTSVIGVWLQIVTSLGDGETYGALLDPWLKEHTQALRMGHDSYVVLRLNRGKLEVSNGEQDYQPASTEEYQTFREAGIFSKRAWDQPVGDDVWATKEERYSVGLRHDARCPVNTENHLEGSIVEAFGALTKAPRGLAINIGGFYGGRGGEDAEAPDDPTVELLRHVAKPRPAGGLYGSRLLCLNCDKFRDVTRLADVQSLVQAEEVDLLKPLPLPEDFRGEVDWLRLDRMPYGQSCQVLRRLLRAGVRPRLVVMLVLSQVPPPFRFTPILPLDAHSAEEAGHPAVLLSCSLSAAAAELEPYGLQLIRLSGPYALFVDKAAWPAPLPISDLDCYRKASIWGYADMPLEFVRDWLFEPTEEVLTRLWSNISDIYAQAGRPGAVFTLGI